MRPAISGLLPHPPIAVPAVGRGRGKGCRQTTEACRGFARELVAARPERLLLVSPHSPRETGSFGIWSGARLTGDLSAFMAPEAAVDLPADAALVAAIEEECRQRGIATWRIPPGPLDHGAVVPLWFLCEAGWSGPTAIVSLPWLEGAGAQSAADPVLFGRAAAAALQRLGGRAALVASGDMTHRAQPGAPAGYDPRAVGFDRELVELVQRGDLERIAGISPELRAIAAEDAAESSALVAAAHDFDARGHEVLSYEHPFGVGYLVAVFHRGDGEQPRSAAGSEPAASGLEVLPAVAREAVRAWAAGRRPAGLPPARGPLAERAAVFVTLRERRTGKLRGCVGSLEPLRANLVEETVDRAVAAASSDPRFAAVGAEELAGLCFEVSVLGKPEPVEDPAALDPAVDGVLVQDALGRRGVLLPGVGGVESAEQQIEIARKKAGIPAGGAFTVDRFRAQKVHEDA